MKYVGLIASLIMPSTLIAGCYNNEDQTLPKREFEICLDQYCFTDVLEYECANTTWAGAGFASGFNVSCSTETQGEGYTANSNPSNCTFKIGYFELPRELRESVTCVENDEGDVGCIWYHLLHQGQ